MIALPLGTHPFKVVMIKGEMHQSELRRLRAEQAKVRQNEVFGGLSREEWARYSKQRDSHSRTGKLFGGARPIRIVAIPFHGITAKQPTR
jgi:hypothetical protein